MRTVRDILAAATFLGTALVFYLVQTTPPTDMTTGSDSAHVIQAIGDGDDCDLSPASLEVGAWDEADKASFDEVIGRES